MERKEFCCAVIGASNIDIGGFPSGKSVMRDSNPGRVCASAGGVGRNIACNLARMGVRTQLITALGMDAYGELVRADCRRAGIDLGNALCFEGASTSVYLFIADEAGDMQLAVSDMEIYKRLTPEALEPLLDGLNAMDAVILDANLSAETLAFLARRIQVPLLADGVSTAKATRMKDAMPYLTAFKPNALEAEALTGIPVHNPDSARMAALKLMETGLHRVFITMGTQGVCCGEDGWTLFLPGVPSAIQNATGAGDAFTAALAWSALRGMTLRECAIAGLAASSIAIEALDTVSDSMSEAALIERMAAISRQLDVIEA